jgi:Fe-S oxidoreductase
MAAQFSEAIAGFSARRTLPKWRRDWFRDSDGTVAPTSAAAEGGSEVVLFADTFNRYFEPENLRAATQVLAAAGTRVHVARPIDGSPRPLCCGRTFLAIGRIDEARREARRSLLALMPFAERGVPIVGLEPSCVYSFRDEIPSLFKGATARRVSEQTVLFEDFVTRSVAAGSRLPLAPIAKRALLHGHCHQKSFGEMGPVEAALKLVPDLAVETIESSCCGMAGAFGYAADTIDASLKMAELSLLPAVRKADTDTLLVADGTSCRHQIHDGTGREALHVARVLAMSVQAAAS